MERGKGGKPLSRCQLAGKAGKDPNKTTEKISEPLPMYSLSSASVKRGIGSCLNVSAFIVIYKTTIPDHLLLGPWSGFGNLRPREGREKVGFFGEIEIREVSQNALRQINLS
jgi:hypothetical protein